MKFNKDNINNTIPAFVTDFKTEHSTNSKLTRGKLKVFYTGETADNRLFTKEFSDKLIKTLPYVPIVTRYDEKSDDFIGHNSEQEVYGVVPGDTELEFVEEDGKLFAVTDVILFTGREDSVGDIASKIIGKEQSLELYRDSIKYVINKDSQGNFKNMEFTDGAISGLSVLGEKQNPAFTGSEFFSVQMTDEELVQAFVNLNKEVNASKENPDGDKQGGVKMDVEGKSYLDFMKKTFKELELEVIDAYKEVGGSDFYARQVGETSMVFDVFNEEAWTVTSFRVEYERTEEGITFTDPVKVVARYLTEEEIENTFISAAQGDGDDESNKEKAKAEENNKTEDEVFTEGDAEVQTGEVTPEKTEIVIEETKEFKDLEEANKKLSEELDGLKSSVAKYESKEKEEILSKYAKLLSEEAVESFRNKFNELTTEELEKELKVETYDMVMQSGKEEDKKEVFESTVPSKKKSTNTVETDAELVARYKNK